MKPSQSGFSLLEIILVVAIISILSLLGTVFYTRFLTQNAVANTAEHLTSQIRKAQIYSMEGKQNSGTWGVNYTTSPKQIQLYLQGDLAFDENYSIQPNVTISPTFNLLFAHLTGKPSGATFPLVITISGNNSQEQISINSEGVVSRL